MASKEESVNKESAGAVINFLKSNVPRSDTQNVEAELKKNFVLAKIKSVKQKRLKNKKKPKHLSRQQKRTLGLFVMARGSIQYDHALPLFRMWENYMCQLLGRKPIPEVNSKGWESFTQTIYKADFHGSLMRVVRSKCASYIGKSGICVMDTRNAFKIVSKDNVLTTIPKKECIFELYFKDVKLTLFGKHVCVRPAERSTKKIKNQQHPDL